MKRDEYRSHLRQMRKNSTDAEKQLWDLLRSRQLERFKFRRQHPIGPYIADFCCLEKRLIVEVDGELHRSQHDEDARRTQFLNEQDFVVIRFWNEQLRQQSTWVANEIFAALERIQRRRVTSAGAQRYHWKSPLPVRERAARSAG